MGEGRFKRNIPIYGLENISLRRHLAGTVVITAGRLLCFVNGGDAFHVWSVTENKPMMNKQARTADNGRSLSLRVESTSNNTLS